jgi:hypothetical protein
VQLADLLNSYGGIATYLGLDLVVIFLMTYVLYFRRHWRADLLLSYVALNLGIFVVMSLLTQVRVDLAVGFGLFAILSIIRLRSSAVTQQEVAYYFIALVLGLVNGLGVPDRGLVVALNVVLLLAMLAFDSKPLRDRSRRMDVHLDGVYTNEAALVAELERKLGVSFPPNAGHLRCGSVILVWPGVEGLERDRAVHSDTGMAPFRVVPALNPHEDGVGKFIVTIHVRRAAAVSRAFR